MYVFIIVFDFHIFCMYLQGLSINVSLTCCGYDNCSLFELTLLQKSKKNKKTKTKQRSKQHMTEK